MLLYLYNSQFSDINLAVSYLFFKILRGSSLPYKPNFKVHWRRSSKIKKDEALLLSLETPECQVSA